MVASWTLIACLKGNCYDHSATKFGARNGTLTGRLSATVENLWRHKFLCINSSRSGATLHCIIHIQWRQLAGNAELQTSGLTGIFLCLFFYWSVLSRIGLRTVHLLHCQLEALRERRPPWPRQIITLTLPTVKMLSLGCERLPTTLKKKKKKKKVLDHYLHHDLGMLPLLWCFFPHLLIL